MKLSKVLRCKIMKCLVSNRILNSTRYFKWKPVQLLKNWIHVLSRRCSIETTSCRIQDGAGRAGDEDYHS